MGINELNPETKKTDMHVFEQLFYLDTVDSDIELNEVTHSRYDLNFDLDIYKLIGKALNNNHQVIQF